MKIIVATIVKNEMHRYLPDAAAAWKDFADEVVFLDNGSTDDTRGFLTDEGFNDITPPVAASTPMWGDESRFRQYLYKQALARAEDGDVVFWLDADMVPLQDPRPWFDMADLDTLFWFNLYDLWQLEPPRYRSDSYWQGHEFWRPWALKVGPEFREASGNWSDRGIHAGHLPELSFQPIPIRAPRNYGLLHYGYATDADRQERARRYSAVRKQLTDFEAAHASTILDAEPALRSLGYTPEWPLYRESDIAL